MARIDSAQRTRILEAAIGVFAENGLNGATTRMVAKAAGFNSALIYYYFENKHTLFVECMRMVMTGLIERLHQPQTFATAEQRISFLMNGIYDYYGTHPARIRLMGVGITLYPDLLGKVIQDFAREKAVFPIQILQEGIEQGQLKPMHPLQVWWSSLGICLLSLQMRRVMEHVPSSPLLQVPTADEGRKQTIDLLCNGAALASKPPKIAAKRSATVRRTRTPISRKSKS